MKTSIMNFFQYRIQHYNPKKYWKYRYKVLDKNYKNMFFKYYYLLYIKRCDAFNNASMGTNINSGAYFMTPPKLPHGLNGIIISHFASFGSNCVIRQQVTVAQNDKNESATFGDNVVIGAGAKIIGKVNVGSNSVIGANAVVTKDVEPNTIVAGVPAKIIRRL